jgi:hypothetical protein
MPEEIEHIDTIGKVKASTQLVMYVFVLSFTHSLIPMIGILFDLLVCRVKA